MKETYAFRPVGMFDSGVGGVSVLREAVKQLPHEHFLFYGDTLHAPYGTKSKEEVLRLSSQVVELLLQHQAKAIVIACNTATSAAAATLRDKYRDLPIIAMEPALKPAHQLRQSGIVLSLATPGTIAGEKYAALYSRYGDGVVSLPCPGLMEFAERGELTGDRLHAFLADLLSPYLRQPVEAVVLGCTHYVFLKDAIGSFFPGVPLIDGNAGTVRQLQRRLQEKGLLADEGQQGSVEFLSSGGEDAIQTMQALFSL